MHVFHPRRSRLDAWLAGRSKPRLDHHVESCERCATRLVERAPALLHLRDALIDALAPPADFATRVEAAIAGRAAARADFELLASLLTLPWQTSRLLLSDDEVRRPSADEDPRDEQVD